jgi:hypothetical protein
MPPQDNSWKVVQNRKTRRPVRQLPGCMEKKSNFKKFVNDQNSLHEKVRCTGNQGKEEDGVKNIIMGTNNVQHIAWQMPIEEGFFSRNWGGIKLEEVEALVGNQLKHIKEKNIKLALHVGECDLRNETTEVLKEKILKMVEEVQDRAVQHGKVLDLYLCTTMLLKEHWQKSTEINNWLRLNVNSWGCFLIDLEWIQCFNLNVEGSGLFYSARGAVRAARQIIDLFKNPFAEQ